MGKGHFLDWIGCATGVAGAALLAANQPWSGWGFVLFLVSNACWYAHGHRQGVPAMSVMQVGFTLTSCLGIWRWLT
jgi:hypothetical protein